LGPRRQLALLWGANSVILLALAPFAQRIVAVVPLCHVKELTGIPCPGCGATTSAYLLARFDPVGAFFVSPLATLVWTFLIAGGLLAGGLALFDRTGCYLDEIASRLSFPSLERLPGFRLAALGVLAANWLYLLAAHGYLGV
jgi:hypothetical protein